MTTPQQNTRQNKAGRRAFARASRLFLLFTLLITGITAATRAQLATPGSRADNMAVDSLRQKEPQKHDRGPLIGQIEAPASDSMTVSLITCFPGPEIYELCGHSAIRIRSAQMDSVWNYGLFDFNQPNFVYRFVKGETDYRMGGYPFAWFLPEYVQRGSRVVEQDLNLTQWEARRLLAMLHEEEKPQNAVYRYNYVRDNCATRIRARLDSVAGRPVLYPGDPKYASFRDEMRHYHRGYPWYQFGIDLALGAGLDQPVTAGEEMFVPVEMMERASTATLPDGRPLVRETRDLNPGRDDATLPATPWYGAPLFWAWVLFLLCAATAFMDVRRGKPARWLLAPYWLLTGLAGCVVWFLVTASSHEATSPNLLMWWLNPLMLVAAVTVCIPRCDRFTNVLMWIEAILTAFLLVSWPFQHQSANAAIFPLMGSAAILSAAYAIIYAKNCYNKGKSKRNAASKPAARRKAPAKK